MLYLATQIWLQLLVAFVLGAATALWWWSKTREHLDAEGVVDSANRPSALKALKASNTRLEEALRTLEAENRSQAERLRTAESRLQRLGATAGAQGHATDGPDNDAPVGLDRLRSDLLHAYEELTMREDELTHRKAEWAERSASLKDEVARLRRELRDLRPAVPSPPPDEPRLPPDLVARVEGQKDDLKRIRGIGVVLERLLNEMGIHTFQEIARWSNEEIDRVQARLPTRFPGRIRRDRWVDQAAELAELDD